MNEENVYSRGKLTPEDLHLFIKGELKEDKMKEIEYILKTSIDDFKQYVSLKESLYLMQNGPKPSLQFKNSILGLVKKQSSIPHIQLLIKIFKDKVSVSSSDQEILEFQGIMTDFTFRGSEPGPISITRKVNGNEVTLSFTPTSDGSNYLLEVLLSKKEDLVAILYIEGEEWEVIRDLTKKSLFENSLPLHGNMELVFKKKGEVQFTIGIVLHNDK
jgi:hypothetical protein